MHFIFYTIVDQSDSLLPLFLVGNQHAVHDLVLFGFNITMTNEMSFEEKCIFFLERLVASWRQCKVDLSMEWWKEICWTMWTLQGCIVVRQQELLRLFYDTFLSLSYSLYFACKAWSLCWTSWLINHSLFCDFSFIHCCISFSILLISVPNLRLW